MALPPTIPTSFVPHSASAPRRFRADMTGAFGFFGYSVLALVFLLSIGVFLYGSILSADNTKKDKELQEKLAAIDPKTVEGFVRLRDRLTSSESLLKKHVAFSTFFSSLEKVLPATVRFTTLQLSLDSAGASKMEGAGVAKSFNALAAASAAFAEDGRIKDAIFSNIRINKDNSVSFSLVTTLDPEIIVFLP